jgi:site-specific recombinase XerD
VYLRIQGSVLKSFAKTFGERPIHTVLSFDIEEWIASNRHWKPETRLNYLKDLRALWNYALKHNYVPENPVDRLERPTVPNVAPGILTLDQSRSLLKQAAQVKGPQSMLPYVAIGLFAGLRSAEITRLDWKEVDLTERLIEVKAENSKTRQRRHVQMSDNLAAWLKDYLQKSGRVVHMDRPEGALSRLADKAKIEPWPKNALRHSYASYHLAKHSDAARTALELGHNSQSLLFRNYRELVKATRAGEYWAITP